MNWEEEYFKKADYARALEQKLSQAERRLAAWEKVQAKNLQLQLTATGPRSSAAVRQARVQDMCCRVSICDEQASLMACSIADHTAAEGADRLIREFKKTITYELDRDESTRVTVATLSAIMERK